MASDDPAHRRNHSANIIPLQDLNGDGAASQDRDVGLARRESHRRTFSERVANLRTGRRDGGVASSRYVPLSERSPSPPARRNPTVRTSPLSPVAFVTSPSGQHERIPDEDDQAAYSPVADRGAFQAAIGFAGLSFQADLSSPSNDSDEEVEQTPPKRARASRASLPSLKTNNSMEDMVSVQLEDGPEFVSPGAMDEEDTLPLTDSSRLRAETARGASLTPLGQRHDRSSGTSPGRSSRLSVRWVGSSPGRSRSGSRLGDDLHVETGVSTGLGRSTSSRKRSLSSASAESPLTNAGNMLRKMSQRVVNVSNEQIDNIVSREIRRRPSARRPSILEPPATISEIEVRDFTTTDGTNSSFHSRASEKTPSASPAVEEPETPDVLPFRDQNPLRGKSLGVFSPESPMRKMLLEFLVHPWWQPFILLLIVIQTIIVAIESAHTVYTNPRPVRWGHHWTDYALFAIFVVYTFEVIIQILVSGFIINPREYSTIDRSVGVRQALINKANDLFALHRQPTIKNGKLRPEAPPSLLRSFTVETFEDMPGASRQAMKVRLARRAFLRHSFNRIDFVAVVSFWISFVLSAAGVVNQYHLYVFEMMSCLRIFRLLNITSGTSVILRSLKRAAPTLLNVSFLIGFFWLLFAIVGVQSFKSSLRRTCVFDGANAFPPTPNYTLNYLDGNGNLQYCGSWLASNGSRMPWLFQNGEWGAADPKGYTCPVGSYCVQGDNPYNGTVSFDNIANSLELVFVVMSTNTFSDIMYDLMNTDYMVAAVYFAVGVVLLTFWLINLLIAVITSSFQVIREESRSSAFMAQETDAEKEPEEDEHEDMNGMNGSIRKMRREPTLKRLYGKSTYFWIAIIVYGLVVNCTKHDTMGHFLTDFIGVSELIVSLVLLGEIVLRFSVDWRGFTHSGRGWFDLFLAVVTTVMEIPVIKHAYDGQAYAWLTVFQILRVYRVVLAISITRDLVLLVLKHVSGVLNLILFVFLLTFLASIFAVQLFRGDLPQEQPSGAALYVTFATIFNAYLGMYQIFSSENWTDILYTVTASETGWGTAWIGAIFIVLWFIFAFFIILNMFIAVIQENFDVNEDQKRLHQVRAILQQSEIGGHSGGTLSLSTIFKFWQHKRQDPLDYGNAAKDMLLKDGLIQEFLDAQFDEELASAKPGISASTTFDILNGKQSKVQDWWTRLNNRIFHSEPNPFYQKMQFTRGYDQLNVDLLRTELKDYQERRKVTQRLYLQKHPKYNVSLYVFKPDSSIRKACQRVVGPGRGNERVQGVIPNTAIWYSFSAFIYLAIVAMVILACYTTPLYQQNYFRNHGFTHWSWFMWSDIGFAALFTVEAAIKVIADGFFWTPNAYYRSSWGFIDGIVLLTLWVNVVTSLYDPGGGSRAVGAFKALRALRLLNVSDSARDTFHSVIILGGWKVISAAFVSISLLIPFAIYGVNLFAGKMWYCSEQNGNGNPINVPLPIYNLTDCIGEFYYTAYNWEFPAPRHIRNNWYSFDSFPDALFLLFQIVSQEGWVEVMWSGQSITGVFTQPSDFATQGNAIFFVVFNLLGAVFVLTLFISVFMRNYTEQTGVAFLTTDQRSWLELRKLLKQVAPSKRPNNKKKRENWQEWCYRRAVTKTGLWHRSVTALLVLHLILLCLEFYPEPWTWSVVRDYLYLGFTVFYIINIIVRIIGLSWTRFRKSAWDVYSVFAIGGTFITTGLLLSNFHQPYYAQLHKLFLVSVVLLLIPRNNQLDQLFKTAAASLTSISNLLATWFVLFLVYAIAMNQAFGLTRFFYNETNNINFRTVPKALILLFRMSVGEGWNMIMEDFARVVPPYCTVAENYFSGDCGSPAWARALFISWNILSMYIFVNLFISLIYESFSYVYQRSNGLSIISREEIRRFKQAWAEYDPNGTGYITKEQFPRFLGELSGVFEMRIYDGDFSVRHLIEDCKLAPKRSSALPLDGASSGPVEIDLVKLNQRLAELPVDEIRTRRQRMNQFYEEVMVSADLDRGIEFNSLLMIIAHYKIIDDSKALKIDEFVRRRARLQRVEEAVRRNIVQGFFDTTFWSRRFRKYKQGKQNARVTAIPDLGVPEIFIQDESDGEDIVQANKFDVPSVAVTPVDYDPSDTADSLSVGRAPTSGSDASRYRQSGSGIRNRSGSIQSSVTSSPTASMDAPYLSARHRPTPSSGSIQPDWHFAAAMENAASGQGLSPPASPGLTGDFGTAMRDRASSNVSQNDMLSLFGDSAWGQSMRRSVTQRRRASGRRPSGT